MSGRIRLLAAVWCIAFASAVAARGAIVFNKSVTAPGDPVDDGAAEAAYLAEADAAGYYAFFEGFTSSAWDGARSTIIGGQHVAEQVTSQGISWRSSEGDFVTTADANDGVTPWHIYSKGGSAQEPLHAVPATIIGESTQTLYGLGLWASGGPPTKGKLHLIIDDVLEVKFEQVIGFDTNNPPEPIKETIRLTSGKQFFGVIVPEGFKKFQVLEVEGVPEDQVLMWAADFRFATNPSQIVGDLDGSGGVDAFDVNDFELALADPQAYIDSHPGLDSNLLGDIDGSGVFDAFDVSAFEQALAGVGAVVPEPGELAMFAAIMFAVVARRGLHGRC